MVNVIIYSSAQLDCPEKNEIYINKIYDRKNKKEA